MISVETIALLQQKVESAVQKIEQLKAENDALRAERSELTKALSEKSELLSRFSADEKKIEDGILGALNRLDAVENALKDAQALPNNPSVQPTEPQQNSNMTVFAEQAPAQAAQPVQSQAAQEPAPAETPAPQAQSASAPSEGQDDGLFGDDSFETQEESDPDIF